MKIYAQLHNPIFNDNPPADSGTDFVNKLISLLVNIFLVGAVLFFLFNFILGGYAWITSKGDKNKLQEAQQKISSAIIGLIIVFLVFVVLKLFGTMFGIEGLENLRLIIPTL